MNEKNKVEALLFATAKRMKIEEITEITGLEADDVKKALAELKMDYENRGTSVTLDESNGQWKLTVKDHYLPMVQKVMTQTELDKPLMETLAVIAWRYPIVQSEVIKIRHNKAYEHLSILEEIGFITRNKYGRTKRISLTQKFFEYFDLPSKEQVKEVFRNAVPEEVRKKIEQEEKEIEEGEKKIEEKKKEETENKEEEIKQEIKEEAEVNEEEVKEEIEKLTKQEEEKVEEIQETEKELEEKEKQEEENAADQMP